MSKLNTFYKNLKKYYVKPTNDGYGYGNDRVNWCHLLCRHNGKLHRFEVRGARLVKDTSEPSQDVIQVSVVNWTMCAGTATLSLNEANVGDWLIEEDAPTVGLLYVE